MTFDASSRLQAAAIGEKVARLSAFIAEDLEERSGRGFPVAAGCYLLIARSPESPVAKALRTQAKQMAAAGIIVRALFCEVGQVAALAAPFVPPGECRRMRDARLLAAHEQLVLAFDRTWIGDSMRREPSKRDTYERFAPNSVETAALASRSFERLWRTAAPIERVPAIPATLASHLPGIAAATPAPESFRRQ